MAKPFRKLVDNMPPERRAKIDVLTQELLSNMPLQEVQRARELTQEQMASTLNLNQNEVAKIEAETDLYLSTFKRFIAAMGGKLEVIIQFPHGNVTIQDFQHLETSEK
jgi:DNA-binding XRE family transcriptional regulator